jgi:hypothetical protein
MNSEHVFIAVLVGVNLAMGFGFAAAVAGLRGLLARLEQKSPRDVS